ncbi:hypothetical protein [Halosaccharopolyspora lacisalsi]|uniref:hypothetical protein n=1 Tax=Halosaccharopolyspora lacisalsi TaxID=1000566 RepID=UPI0015FDB02F|nr:hypothetical protein [Halosaccharopolyspora lacisalsi]
MQLKEFHDRIKDERDPVDEPEVTDLVAALHDRWSGEPDAHDYDDSALVITTQSVRPDQPVTTRVVSQDRLDELDTSERDSVDLVAPMDLELDMVFTRPKGFVTRIVHSGIGTQAGIGDQAWSIGFLLDAALSPQDAAHVQARWGSSDPDDLLDIRPMADIVTALLSGWGEQDRSNRAQRRSAARAPKKRPGNPGGNKSRKTSPAS